MSTISQGTCDELKTVGAMTAWTIAGTTGYGALTAITATAGAAYGALLIGSFVVCSQVMNCIWEDVDKKVRLVVSFLFATVAAALLTPVLTGMTITVGSALMLDIASIVSMFVLFILADLICGNGLPF